MTFSATTIPCENKKELSCRLFKNISFPKKGCSQTGNYKEKFSQSTKLNFFCNLKRLHWKMSFEWKLLTLLEKVDNGIY